MKRLRLGCLALLIVSSAACSSAITVAKRPWLEVKREGVTLLTTRGETEGRELIDDVDLFMEVVAHLAHLPPDRRRLDTRVVVFEGGDLVPFVPSRDIAGMLLPDIEENLALVAAGDAYSQEVLYHELTHALLNQSGALYPNWYKEGLAEFLSTASIGERSVQLGRPPAREGLARLQRLARGQGKITAVGSHVRKGLEEDPDLEYARYWAIVDFLILGHIATGDIDRRAELADFLALVNEGVPHEAALSRAFGMTWDQLVTRATKFLARDSLPSVRMPIPAADSRAAPGVSPASPSRVMCLLGDVSAMMDKTQQAFQLYELAGATDPGAVCGAVAAAGLVANDDLAEGTRRLDALAGRADHDPRFHVTRGAVMMLPLYEDREAGRPVPASAVVAARRHFERALSLTPDDPMANYYFGSSYKLTSGDPAPGITALEKLVARGAASVDLFLTLAELHARGNGHVTGRFYLAWARRLIGERSLSEAGAKRVAMIERALAPAPEPQAQSESAAQPAP